MEEIETGLVGLCIEAAARSRESVEKWRRQRRTLERLPTHLGDALFRRLHRRGLLFPSLLEIFQHCVENIDLKYEAHVDAEWMAYLGGYRYLRALCLADCRTLNNSALWPITGMNTLKELDLSRCIKINDTGVAHVVSISSLEKLRISETKLSTKGIMMFSSLKNLQLLDLGGLPVTDEALCSLQGLTKLEHLDLWGSKVSSNCIHVLKRLTKLRYLNLAWTTVNNLPDLPSLMCLNMSNCTIHSIFDGESGSKAPLEELYFAGSTFISVDEIFSCLPVCLLTHLDMSKSILCTFQFLRSMKKLKHLDLSFSGMADDQIEAIIVIGESLRILNLSNTKVTSLGITFLTGHVPNLEVLCLSKTAIDDTSLPYIGMMPSLKNIDLSRTKIRGLPCRQDDQENETSSLTALQNLNRLQSLNLEETHLTDETLLPVCSMKGLEYIYLKTESLSDISLHSLTCLSNLKFLGFCESVLTNEGLQKFRPMAKLLTLDLRGCWLLGEDAILLFCRKYPHIEVRHELNKRQPVHQTSSRTSFHSLQPRSDTYRLSHSFGLPSVLTDQRIKYSREELFDLQVSSEPYSALTHSHAVPPELLMEN